MRDLSMKRALGWMLVGSGLIANVGFELGWALFKDASLHIQLAWLTKITIGGLLLISNQIDRKFR